MGIAKQIIISALLCAACVQSPISHAMGRRQAARNPEVPADALLLDSFEQIRATSRRPEGRPPVFRPDIDHWMESITGEPFTFGNQVRLLVDGPEFYPVRRRMIAEAARTIDLRTYLWCDDEAGITLAEDLARAARERNVRVRVVIDFFNIKEHDRAYKILRDAGIEVLVFNPPYWGLSRGQEHIHEKIMVVDGSESLVGGANLCDEYMLETAERGLWHDLEVHLKGPIVSRVQERFDITWNWMARQDARLGRNDDTSGGYRNPYLGDPMRPVRRPRPGSKRDYTIYGRTPSDGSPVGVAMGHYQLQQPYIDKVFSKNFMTMYAYLFRLAQRKIVFYAPYLIPPETFEKGIMDASKNGREVIIITNSEQTNDMGKNLVAASLGHYGRLLAAGARIFESQRRTFHAKAVLIDDKYLLVGSHNFTHRSFNHNGEVSVMTDDQVAIDRFHAMYRTDMLEALEVTQDDVDRRTDSLGEAIYLIFGKWFETLF